MRKSTTTGIVLHAANIATITAQTPADCPAQRESLVNTVTARRRQRKCKWFPGALVMIAVALCLHSPLLADDSLARDKLNATLNSLSTDWAVGAVDMVVDAIIENAKTSGVALEGDVLDTICRGLRSPLVSTKVIRSYYHPVHSKACELAFVHATEQYLRLGRGSRSDKRLSLAQSELLLGEARSQAASLYPNMTVVIDKTHAAIVAGLVDVESDPFDRRFSKPLGEDAMTALRQVMHNRLKEFIVSKDWTDDQAEFAWRHLFNTILVQVGRAAMGERMPRSAEYEKVLKRMSTEAVAITKWEDARQALENANARRHRDTLVTVRYNEGLNALDRSIKSSVAAIGAPDIATGMPATHPESASQLGSADTDTLKARSPDGAVSPPAQWRHSAMCIWLGPLALTLAIAVIVWRLQRRTSAPARGGRHNDRNTSNGKESL